MESLGLLIYDDYSPFASSRPLSQQVQLCGLSYAGLDRGQRYAWAMTSGPPVRSLDLAPLHAARDFASPDDDLELLIPESPRAHTDVMMETPRTAIRKDVAERAQFQSAPELHGKGPVALATNGTLHASIGTNGKLAVWHGRGTLQCQVLLQLPVGLQKNGSKQAGEISATQPAWMGFDCAGTTLGVHRPGVGLWLANVSQEGRVSEALLLGDQVQSAMFTWVGFSPVVPGLLAVGTDGGRIMIFSPSTGKLTSQKEGKHPGRQVSLRCGDWLHDGRGGRLCPARAEHAAARRGDGQRQSGHPDHPHAADQYRRLLAA